MPSSSDHPAQKISGGRSASPELKARGANRSTKVAGKLKVLPEQPEPATAKVDELPAKPLDENVATTGDSDEGDIDDDDQEESEYVEVSCEHLYSNGGSQTQNRSTTKFP
jgi:hypothetical protein